MNKMKSIEAWEIEQAVSVESQREAGKPRQISKCAILAFADILL